MVHPLDQLTPAEAKKALGFIYKANPGAILHFKTVQAQEPSKAVMTAYLDAEHAGKPVTPPPRIAYSVYYIMNERRAEELWINLETGLIVQRLAFPAGTHPPIDLEETFIIEPIMLKHPEIIKAFKKLGLSQHEIDCVSSDGWMYGCDEVSGYESRYIMFLMYMRDPKTNHPESNIYAFPLPFVPVFDVLTKEFVRIDWCATGGDGDDEKKINYNTRNTTVPITDTFKPVEYLAELRDTKPRTGLKPYHVLQPDGPSFDIKGSLVEWQGWSFRVCFNPREGAVLQDLRFDGRPVFYRLSVSEMTVPYGDPRPPMHRKQAFDLGDVGAGYAANSLGLGCDCLGVIKYFDGTLVHPDGSIESRKNVVCMHEQDDGILLKHTNYRTNVGRVARRRILVLQFVITVDNYEYIFAWHLDQAAGVKLEIRATGIMSTQYIDPGKKSKWGTLVAPSVLAANHQHVFSVRIDPALDGWNNSVQVNEIHLDNRDEVNPYGTGFYNKKTYVENTAAFDIDQSINRYVTIVNENKINPITMEPVGYRLFHQPTALLLAPEGTVARNRARYATHHFWVTKHQDGEFFAGGRWTNQSSVERQGLADLLTGAPVRNADVVLNHSFAITHTTRVEEFPVMPAFISSISLEPDGFFTENPAMDLPTSTQEFNRSVEVKECCSEQRL